MNSYGLSDSLLSFAYYAQRGLPLYDPVAGAVHQLRWHQIIQA